MLLDDEVSSRSITITASSISPDSSSVCTGRDTLASVLTPPPSSLSMSGYALSGIGGGSPSGNGGGGDSEEITKR
eukprot:m.63843 g.63843  ORF g.63843 m.63843 type:complete len:75 (+) comp35196_c0_seq1:749-973(+)